MDELENQASERTASEEVPGILATGFRTPPPAWISSRRFPSIFLLFRIPKREKTGLSGWQSHQDCTQWVSSSKEKLGCYRLTEEMGHGKARTSLSTGLHLRRRELSEFKAVSPLPSLPNFLSQFPKCLRVPTTFPQSPKLKTVFHSPSPIASFFLLSRWLEPCP